jgi:hypothetical protein
MRTPLVAALVALGMTFGCNYPQRHRAPAVQTGTTSRHFGESQATLNTAPGIDAFGAGVGGAGQGGSGRAGLPKLGHAAHSWKGSLVTRQGVWSSNLGDEHLMRRNPQTVTGLPRPDISATGQNAYVGANGTGGQRGQKSFQSGSYGGAGPEGVPY